VVPKRRRPPTDPSRITLGLRGYTHRVRSRAPSREETLLGLTTMRPLLAARGLARAPRLPIYDNTSAWPLAPALPMMPAKVQAQEDMPRATEARGLPDAAPWHDIASHFPDKVTHGA